MTSNQRVSLMLDNGPMDLQLTVHGHFIDLSTVVLLYIAKNSQVLILNKVDCNTLASETTGTTDAVNVQLTVVGQIVAAAMNQSRVSFFFSLRAYLITRETCCTSIPRAHTSVVISTRLDPTISTYYSYSPHKSYLAPCRNSCIMASRSF